VTLTDAGPLVALIDRDEEAHAECVVALDRLSGPMVTTWTAFAEAMYILGDRTGWRGQEGLFRMVLTEALQVEAPRADGTRRLFDLMEKYRDLPMDLADATLVLFAEEAGLDRIFTLDDDFRVYRLPGKRAFSIIP
jgi:Predicted nucleic acid-binding protein, contains PIN domain